MRKVKLTQTTVTELFEHRNGQLIWKKNLRGPAKKGTVAGWLGSNGYFKVGVNGSEEYVHRIIWLLHHGYLPENNLDHIDRNKTNNKIENLREASQSCNMRNYGNKQHNKTGVNGVCWKERYKKWHANIVITGTQIHLGYYKNFKNAVHARYSAEQVFGWESCNNLTPAHKYLKRIGFI